VLGEKWGIPTQELENDLVPACPKYGSQFLPGSVLTFFL
jgi:hypothetical protein